MNGLVDSFMVAEAQGSSTSMTNGAEVTESAGIF